MPSKIQSFGYIYIKQIIKTPES
uniref:Uncharacterized protein n=1 Tax=Rhizophora mucronata TaxID=61149 RepID=A0A2P2IJY3_RHIMU